MTDQPKMSPGSSKDASDAPKREISTWELFGEVSREFIEQTVTSGWIPDLIAAIARGGLVPADAVSHAMGTKACGMMSIEFYTGVGQTLEEPQLFPPLMGVFVTNGKRVPIVDDVADSGRTLRMVMDLVKGHGLSFDGEAQVEADARCAVIYRKPVSIIEPDYVWRHTGRWINFPWSMLPIIIA